MYVELKNIDKNYGSYKASDNINIGIEKGKLVALLGPSGSGKTTILRMIAGLETPNAGDIIIDGNRVNDIAPSERGIGFVFQNYALFRYMTVYENLAFGLEIKKVPKKQIKERVSELIELTGLKGLEKRYPNQLSGGQRQRVAFARALAPNPSLLLLDEPFAAIDAKVRAELRSWLREMIHKVGITSIFVTHDQDEAVEVADEIIITNKGRIEQIATPIEIYKNPQTPFVAEFIGQSSKVEGYYNLRGFEKGSYKGAIIRPEFVESFKSDNMKFKDVIAYSEDGIIEDISFRGNCLEVKLRVGDILLTTKRSLERRPIQIGEKMHVIVYRLYAYDDERAYLLENKELIGKEIVTF
ncbi:ABC transporter ATP-binding protein [Candidatus Galacturonibacter soehngenii]|uniref:ABC-type quaternary amine transporter n=1 Tax=Candidatus Galacturonatibacter soehngenii TaxID=2307010 RepID=A0A7V7QMX3_9FIRM|nr:sulfate ABC transporter ATP-binding protein [Candidatus Galacturonibacter soehngenii]KAB1439973.1 sulfate ABC transporter ATP-binding protein [Candidatus Galacturonibacter soehngenii]